MDTTTQIRVRGYHEDRYGHVNNARYLEFLEEARWAHLEERGLDTAFFREHGVFPVVVRLSISYRRPASAGDVLRIATGVTEASSRKLVIHQTARFSPSDEVCIEADVSVVFLDAESGRPVPISDSIVRVWPELAALREGG